VHAVFWKQPGSLDDWVRDMGNKALIKEAHHTTHIEGTQLTLDQAERLWDGEEVPEADPEDTRELLNYRSAFEFVSECLDSGDPITEGLIREIHRKLVEGVRGGKLIRAITDVFRTMSPTLRPVK
jgi:Fic family protein